MDEDVKGEIKGLYLNNWVILKFVHKTNSKLIYARVHSIFSRGRSFIRILNRLVTQISSIWQHPVHSQNVA